jgi:hypothetical protein
MRYEGVAARLQGSPDLDTPAVWAGLQVIESAFLAVSSKRRDQAKDKKTRHAE